ncbi:putative sulfoacetate transporter SauU [Pirellula sp. SH-Sr6A]|uniref:MFS transporter n=1 Tax=Pirellula sp. SH-Sr6A TaxID=1632865 RepID=UPI00078C9505|nr:MFS transporter [Pirellula sp. SH-Sr6A]AMV30834.1 putative sulfoacetate transporter SauU [Pirellula sp. SH-Sr6A]
MVQNLPNRTSAIVLIGTVLLAVNMYVDRAAVGQLRSSISAEFGWERDEAAYFIGAFFWAYALGQVPAAALGLRFGFKTVLTVFLVLWSGATILTGLSQSFAVLISSRVALGLAEAGAYPNANALIRGWFPERLRGRACSAVTFGGRLGWAISQFLTPILEVAFSSWRAVLIVYGVVGILLAIPFHLLAKDGSTTDSQKGAEPPDQIDTREVSSEQYSAPGAEALTFGQMLVEPNLVRASLVQFLLNFGWVFLLSDLPSYLTGELGVGKVEAGFLSSLPAWVSCVGMVAGGIITDWTSRHLGLRWGRSLPIAMSMFVCGIVSFVCPWFTHPLSFVALLSVMAIAADISNPSVWAFSQDIGGRNAGKVLGWVNMFGNFGAGLSPVAISMIQRQFGWDACFWAFSLCFVVAGVTALGMDSNRKLNRNHA